MQHEHPSLNLELLTGSDCLLALRPEWEALWRRVPETAPFQSPAWLLAWWSVFGSAIPVVVIARQAERLVGLLPLYILDEPPARKLLPIGAGITDYLDALIAPEAPPDTARCLLELALAGASRFSVTECALQELPPQSPLVIAPVPPGWKERPPAQTPCPILFLPEWAGGLRGAVPAGRLRDIRQSLHRAERIGGCSFDYATPATLHRVLSDLIRFHESRWAVQRKPSVLRDPAVIEFHRLAAPELAAAGCLRLQLLRIAGQPAAAIYALLAAGRMFFYMSGFDPGFSAQSPGTILLGHMIEQAVQEGRRELHFLRGDEAYKHSWGAIDRMNTTRLLVPA
jgi:CelD/BcsL family acetyltransferase involved in cellulose biosynthesis